MNEPYKRHMLRNASRSMGILAITMASCIVAACSKAPLLPDQLHWRSRNLHLIFAINGVPAKVELGSGFDNGFKEVAQFEMPGDNLLEVIAIPIITTKLASATIRIHANKDDKSQAAEIAVESPVSSGEQRASTHFRPIGQTHWNYAAAQGVKRLSQEDRASILANAAESISAFERRDTAVIKGADEIFRQFPNMDIQGAERLQIIEFDRGVVVVAKNLQPIIRLYDAAKPNGGEVDLTSFSYYRANGKWIPID